MSASAKMHPAVGISKCLTGEKTRYDGKAKPCKLVTEILSEFFDWSPVCPEVDAGLAVPRPAVQLVKSGSQLAVLGVEDPAMDLTDTLVGFAEKHMQSIGHLCGFILKARSPSCGIHDTPVFETDDSQPAYLSSGVFAYTLSNHYPAMPMIDEAQLAITGMSTLFVRKVFCYQRWREFLQSKNGHPELADFYQSHRHLLQLHSPDKTAALQNRIADMNDDNFILEVMSLLSKPVSAEHVCRLFQYICSEHQLASDHAICQQLDAISEKLLAGYINPEQAIVSARIWLMELDDADDSTLINPDPDESRLISRLSGLQS